MTGTIAILRIGKLKSDLKKGRLEGVNQEIGTA